MLKKIYRFFDRMGGLAVKGLDQSIKHTAALERVAAAAEKLADAKPPLPASPKSTVPDTKMVDRAFAEYKTLGRDRWLSTGTPWFTEGAKSWLEANVLPTDRVLEFGGGRSTIFWATRAERVTTVEASPDWFFWIYMNLYNNPDLMKRVRLHFIPCEWNPDFEKGLRRYWTDNRQSLNTQDIVHLERDLISARHPGNNILLFDGSLRGPVFVYQLSKVDFDEVDVIVVDNAELQLNCYAGDHLIPNGYTRLDFVAGSKDEIPKHQDGKHITAIYVKNERFARSTTVVTEISPLLSREDRAAHILGEPLTVEEVIKKIEGIGVKLRATVDPDFRPRIFGRPPA